VSQTPSNGPQAARFPTTQWSRIISAGDPDTPLARESLAELCNAYWYPLYAYIRRRGYDSEQARDLTQDFFARALDIATALYYASPRLSFTSMLLRVAFE
jgi:RNA polymerase sigma-70 factor (ECF subfamily)